MLYPGHIYKVVDGVYTGLEVILNDIDFNSNSPIAHVTEINSGDDIIIVDLNYLQETNPVEKLFCITTNGLQITDDYGKHIRLVQCIEQELQSEIINLKNNGYKDSQFFNITDLTQLSFLY